jgi:bifunctional DNA-binding transcriptional regulator/antitoxin component of YhaV-PrlF toxin-antitoxin module
MQQLVSITGQGQISIPVGMRRALGLDKYNKAWISLEKDSLRIDPVPDLLELGGSLKKYAIKGKTADQIMSLEKKAVGEAIIERYKKSLR